MTTTDPAGKPTILVVDDTPDNLTLMSGLLKSDYQVKVANSGEKALKIVASEFPPDLILLDIMMPGMDGYAVCEELKRSPATQNIPVIFLTAKAEVADEKKGLELGAVDYITKPISPPLVLARVKNHLALKAMADFLRDKNDILEREVAKRLRELMAVQEVAVKNIQLEQASRMKSEFLANMSHELRTPLNAIIGFSEVLKDGLLGELAPQQKDYVNDIYASGNHLLSLINDILDLSKVEAGKMSLELEPLEVPSLLQAALQVVREQAVAQRLTLTSEIAKDLGEVWLDQRKVKQILYNLLSNAVKFTPEGGQVHVAARRVGGECVPDATSASYLELTVRDSGIGLSADDQTRLFQPFTQIDSRLARRYEGTGLGLSLVKRLAELHGGTVGVLSTPEQGATFTVWLPLRTSAETPATTSAPPATAHLPQPAHEGPLRPAELPAAPTRFGAYRPLALVIEDDDPAAELLRLQLVNSGFRVARAGTAEIALKMAQRECPDLITLDIMLPGIDGWEFLKRLKKHPQFAEVPVVIISNVADRRRGLALGAAQVLQKPVGREELARVLSVGFPAGSGGQRRTVLVVDDDPKAVELLGAHLGPAGYRVLSAFSGQEGIDLARRDHPDLIVLDLLMPEANGFDVVTALKSDPTTAAIPIVIVTAMEMTAAEGVRLNENVFKVLSKSTFNHDNFINEVKHALAETVI